ncbi:hypothetical protein F4808DRAFT_434811 [Astrocystis sublimbata]|nr:hypothetical protein F4808DRAFT_434811 [Astrocystis sublimbata]
MPTSIGTLPADLSPPLSPREAIADALYRCFAGLDTPDQDLWESAFTQDACCIMDDHEIEGIEEINVKVYEPTSKLDTTHFVTNLRIHIEGNGTEARMSASTLAQHYRPGTGRQPNAPRLLAGGPYMIHLVKDAEGSLWRIKRFHMRPKWAEGDITVITGQGSTQDTA